MSEPSGAPERLARLSDDDGAALLRIAEEALRHHLGLGPPPALPQEGALAAPRGAFVTLRRGGALRGCVGTFTPSGSLGGTVARMAVSAASEDPRFSPLAARELRGLDVHVTVLHPRRPMNDPSDLVVGRDGVLVQRGLHRGTLLPQVAVEEGWDALTFLRRTCLKAGLPPDAWEDPAATVELFAAEELSPAAAELPPSPGESHR